MSHKKSLPLWAILGSYIFIAVLARLALIVINSEVTTLLLVLPVVVAAAIYSLRVYIFALILTHLASFIIVFSSTQSFGEALLGTFIMLIATVGISEFVRRINSTRVSNEKESNTRFRNVVDNLDEGLIITDKAGIVQYMNSRMAELTGYAPDELIGKEAYRFLLTEAQLPLIRQKLQERVQGKAERYELLLSRKDGTQFWSAVTGTPLRNSVDEIIGISIACADITQRKQAEEALAREHIAFNTLMETIPDSIYYKDTQGRYILVNQAEANELGITNAELAIGKTDFAFYSADISEQAARDEDEIIRTGSPLVNKLEEHLHTDGRLVYLSTSKVPVRDLNGKISGIVGISRDITRQVMADKALRTSEEQLRSLIASMDNLIFSIDFNGRILFYHDGVAKVNTPAASPSDMIGKPYQEVLPPPLVQKLESQLNSLTSTLQLKQFNYSLEVNGRERFYRTRISRLIDTSINLIGLTGVSTDITELVQASQRQQRLLKLEQLNSVITAQLLQSDDLSNVMDDILASFGKDFDVARAYMFQFNDPWLVNTQEWHSSDIASEPMQTLNAAEVIPSLLSMLTREGSLVISEANTLPADLSSFFASRNVIATLIMPVYLDNQLHGIIGFDETRRARNWLPEEIAAVRSLVQSYSTALERRNAKQALIEARDAALRSARLKSEFMSNMSHEIRTPMTGLLGMLELLLETELDALQLELGQTAFDSGNKLLDILNDILDFSKIEANKVVIETVATDLRAVVAQVKSTLGINAQNKHIELIVNIPESIPQRVMCDPTRLRQVLMNLTSNAIKFTAQGSVEIRVREVRQTPSQCWFRFEVEDTGIGIAPDQLGHIFDSFVQADGSTTRKYGGTGLGLAISKQLVELMGGQLDVTSVKGQGSTFGFTVMFPLVTDEAASNHGLPINQQEHLLALASSQLGTLPQAASAAPRAHVLFAEDNPVIQVVMLNYLKLEGCTVTLATTGKEALALVQEQSFDLIFMDIHMPEMDGLEATRRIRELATSKQQIPIIAVTASILPTEKTYYLDSGFNAILEKPFTLEQLRATMKQWVKLHIS